MARKKKLPDANEPVVLSDGTEPEVVTVQKTNGFVKVPTNHEAVQQVMATRRKVADLPAPPKELNAVLLVVSYYFIGLDDEEIALALNLTVSQVANIKMTQAFDEMVKNITENIAETGMEDVRSLLQTNAKKAATRIVGLVSHPNAEYAMSASKDVLDRAGFRPADVVEHRTKHESSLRIEVIKRDETQRTPIIDINPSEV